MNLLAKKYRVLAPWLQFRMRGKEVLGRVLVQPGILPIPLLLARGIIEEVPDNSSALPKTEMAQEAPSQKAPASAEPDAIEIEESEKPEETKPKQAPLPPFDPSKKHRR